MLVSLKSQGVEFLAHDIDPIERLTPVVPDNALAHNVLSVKGELYGNWHFVNP